MNHIDVYYMKNINANGNRHNHHHDNHHNHNHNHSPFAQMNLGEKDMLLQNVEAKIEAKRAMLLKKRQHLEHASKENEFLGMVKNDYQKYYDYIIGQKQDQMKAMTLLKTYVDDLIVTGKMTDADLQNAKQDQVSLMGEVGKIKKSLDELVCK